jgi:hypothetical protein
MDASADERTFVQSRTRLVVRLAASAGPATAALAAGKPRPAPYVGLHASSAIVASAAPALAARRGLLAAVLGALCCVEDQELDEGALFDALRADSRLADAGRDDGEDFADQGAGAQLLARWQDVVRKDFVDARFLTCRKVERAEGEEGGGGGGGGGGAAARGGPVNRYGVGPAARASVGMVGILEIVRRVRGDGAEAAGLHTREKTKAALGREVGATFFEALKKDTYGAADFAGAEEGGEEEEEEEEEEA